MVITDNRIQNVLRIYSNQLKRSKLLRKLESGDPRSPSEKVSISEDGKYKSTMEQVTSRAFEQAEGKQAMQRI